MNKRLPVGVCISLIAISCAVTFVVTWTVSFNRYNALLAVNVRDDISEKLREIDSYVRSSYIGTLNENKLAAGILGGYISGVDDKNTVYMTAEEYGKLLREESGKLVTAGMRAVIEDNGYIRVAEVYAGSSAESDGIVKDDIITVIEGVDVLGSDAEAAVKLLDGEDGTRLSVTIMHDGELSNHVLRRQAIDIKSVYSIIANNIGIIRVTEFHDLTAEQFGEAMDVCENSGVKALIIDLRQNSGNNYAPMQKILSRLVSANAIAYTEYKNGFTRDFIVTDGEGSGLPTAVLTDNNTSGPAELLAMALKTFNSAQLVGGNTPGSATLQNSFKLKDGSAVRVPIAYIKSEAWEDYNGIGLTPDYAIEMSGGIMAELDKLADLNNVSDLQMKKAFEVIETMTGVQQ